MIILVIKIKQINVWLSTIIILTFFLNFLTIFKRIFKEKNCFFFSKKINHIRIIRFQCFFPQQKRKFMRSIFKLDS